MTRRQARTAMTAVLWIAAVMLLAAAGAMYFLPRFELGKGAMRLMQAAGTAGAPAKDQEEDALRVPERREAVGSEAGRVEVRNGYTVLQIDPQIQQTSGLRTEPLKAVTFAPEIAAFGRVVDIQPLLAARARYTAAQSQADVTRTTLAAAKAEYERLASLHREQGAIATKRIQQAEAEWKRNQAELRRFEAETAAVRDEIVQQWGQVLTGWALGAKSEEFDRLVTHKDALLLVTMPPGTSLPAGPPPVLIGRGGDREHAVPATYVSPAPVTDPVVQGETHYFRVADQSLRAGMRIDVWVEQPKNAATGVIVPQSAVVWALGQAWVYVRLDASHFVRRPISTETQAPGGWFVTGTIRPGDPVVLAGAQMLYAEEFRSQIHDEDAD